MRKGSRRHASLSDLTERLEAWFRSGQRPLPWRRLYEPYAVWVSEVMLQQTRMEVVLGRFDRFMERFPTVAALASADEEQVLAEWSGLGYYRRARMLHEGARKIAESFGGELPRSFDELRRIPGIGRYTAGAILSIAFNEKAAIVDGNVARVLARVFALVGEAGSAELTRETWARSAELVDVAASPRDFNQAMMELGATVCRPVTPLCRQCPIETACVARRRGLEGKLPRTASRAATVSLVIPLWIVTDGRGAVLFRLHHGRLMGGMFHLPQGSSALLGQSDDSFVAGERLGTFGHTVTNRRIRFEVFAAEMRDTVGEGGDYEWIHPADLPGIPHSSYVAKALKVAGLVDGAGRLPGNLSP